MKTFLEKTALFLLAFCLFSPVFGQETGSLPQTVITKNDGTQYIGVVVNIDEREILFETTDLGTFYIPRHEIKSMRSIKAEEMRGEKYVGENRFATRYFYSTNGLPMEKGEHYAMINLYGPEVHFAPVNNLSVGLMTSWVALPVVGSVKYSIPLTENLSLGVGSLIGSMTWVQPKAFGVLGYGSLTIGNRRSNLTFSGGAAFINEGEYGGTGSAPLASVAGMVKVGKKTSLVFDSFIYMGKDDKFTVLIPGLRLSPSEKSAIQFGFTGLIIDGDAIPIPIPMISYFHAFN